MLQIKSPIIPLAYLFIANLFISGVASTIFSITNKCNYTVWPGIAGGAALSTTGFSLQKNESNNITVPFGWSGRVWGRTYCTQNSTGNFSCITGDCGTGKVECSGNIGTFPATLVEITLGDLDFFYVSIADGFNLPLLLEPKGGTGNCSSLGCMEDLNKECPTELKVTSIDGKGVGCRSPCDVTNASLFCCSGRYGSLVTCKPTLYSLFFKKACPLSYSYAYDNNMVTCSNATGYLITFCPRTSQNSPFRAPPASEKIAPSPLTEIRLDTGTRRNVVPIIAGLTGGSLVIVTLLVILILRIRRWSNFRKTEEDAEDDHIKQVPGMPVRFSYEDLCVATNDFIERLGRGGFGSVFKGVLPDGTGIAVKRLDRLGQEKRAFLAEVETIGSLHHFNLVRLIGFCEEKSQRLLAYEYMSNGSLDKWAFKEYQRSCLGWQTRKKIILDIAKGLAYLHEECRQTIIHLDIKPQNILLDPNFNAKISDFGLSKLIDRDMGQVEISMRGTPGYLAPEWVRSLGHITVKVDTYSFGIVLLEVVCGRKNIMDHSQPESAFHLLRMLQKKAEQDKLLDIVENLDENMQSSEREEMLRTIKLGAWCLQDAPERRPSMSTVVKVLEGLMEVDPNLVYRFSHSLMTSFPVVNHHPFSVPPLPSVLSNPR